MLPPEAGRGPDARQHKALSRDFACKSVEARSAEPCDIRHSCTATAAGIHNRGTDRQQAGGANKNAERVQE